MYSRYLLIFIIMISSSWAFTTTASWAAFEFLEIQSFSNARDINSATAFSFSMGVVFYIIGGLMEKSLKKQDKGRRLKSSNDRKNY